METEMKLKLVEEYDKPHGIVYLVYECPRCGHSTKESALADDRHPAYMECEKCVGVRDAMPRNVNILEWIDGVIEKSRSKA
jgi:transcription elongation factor Elf1